MDSSDFTPHRWPSLSDLDSPAPAPAPSSGFNAWDFEPSSEKAGFAPLRRDLPKPAPEDPAKLAAAVAAQNAAQAAEQARLEGFEAGAEQARSQARAAQEALAQAQMKIRALEELLTTQRRAAADVAEQAVARLLDMVGAGRLSVDESAWRMAYRCLLEAAQGRGAQSVSTHPDSVEAAQAALADLPQFGQGLRVLPSPGLAVGELALEADGQAWAASIADAALRLRDAVGAEAERARSAP